MLPPAAHVIATLTPSMHGETLPHYLWRTRHLISPRLAGKDVMILLLLSRGAFPQGRLLGMGPSEAGHFKGGALKQGGALKTGLKNETNRLDVWCPAADSTACNTLLDATSFLSNRSTLHLVYRRTLPVANALLQPHKMGGAMSVCQGSHPAFVADCSCYC